MIVEVDFHYYDRDGVYRWSPERRVLAWRHAFRDFDRQLAASAVPHAVLTVGIPGSGKSTWARSVDHDSVVILDGVSINPRLRERAIAIARRRGVALIAAWIDTPWDVWSGSTSAEPGDEVVRHAAAGAASEEAGGVPVRRAADKLKSVSRVREVSRRVKARRQPLVASLVGRGFPRPDGEDITQDVIMRVLPRRLPLLKRGCP